MKKLMIATLTLTLFGCTNASVDENTGLQVLSTSPVGYDWATVLTEGTEISVAYLTDNGQDMHSYQVSAKDIADIMQSDLFIYVGGPSDEWVEDIELSEDHQTINMMEVLDGRIYMEEEIEGMTLEEEEEEEEADEHVWLSLTNAKIVVQEIANQLIELAPEDVETIQDNLDRYLTALDDLDDQYRNTIADSSLDTILVGDRFPYRYLVEDYGLNYYAAFPGCSAETEASFETIRFLSQKLGELSLHVVIVPEKSDTSIAETIIDNTTDKDQIVMELDSYQSVTASEMTEGRTYLSAMTNNLEVLRAALEK